MAKVKRELKLIEVGGTPFQIGFQYGEACPEIKKMLVDMVTRHFRQTSSLSQTLLSSPT